VAEPVPGAVERAGHPLNRPPGGALKCDACSLRRDGIKEGKGTACTWNGALSNLQKAGATLGGEGSGASPGELPRLTAVHFSGRVPVSFSAAAAHNWQYRLSASKAERHGLYGCEGRDGDTNTMRVRSPTTALPWLMEWWNPLHT